jgi:hypothetical protein
MGKHRKIDLIMEPCGIIDFRYSKAMGMQLTVRPLRKGVA